MERGGAVRDGDGMLDAARRSDELLELATFGPIVSAPDSSTSRTASSSASPSSGKR